MAKVPKTVWHIAQFYLCLDVSRQAATLDTLFPPSVSLWAIPFCSIFLGVTKNCTEVLRKRAGEGVK